MGANTNVRRRTAAGFIAGLSLAVVSAFAVQTFTAGATGSDSEDSLFVAMAPCRLADTRPTDSIGPNSTFGANDTKWVQATGTNGQCTIPEYAVGLSLNVTAVNATMSTYVTVWPEGTKPNASSLNPEPGQVAFNAVTTTLSADGAFLVYNLQGSLDVIIDVNGYYTPPPPAAVTASNHAGATSIADYPGTVLVSTPLTAPGDGKVTVTAGAHLYNFGFPIESMLCTISTNAEYDAEFGIYPEGSFSSTRVFDVKAGETATYSLVCLTSQAGPGASNNFISAIYTPAA